MPAPLVLRASGEAARSPSISAPSEPPAYSTDDDDELSSNLPLEAAPLPKPVGDRDGEEDETISSIDEGTRDGRGRNTEGPSFEGSVELPNDKPSSPFAFRKSSGLNASQYIGFVTSTDSWAGIKQVRFEDDCDLRPSRHRKARRRVKDRYRMLKSRAQWLLCTAEALWRERVRPWIMVTSLYELWSMAIWLGFLMEVDMAPSLVYIAFADIACNALYIADCLVRCTVAYVEQRSMREAFKRAERRKKRESGSRRRRASRNSVGNDDMALAQNLEQQRKIQAEVLNAKKRNFAVRGLFKEQRHFKVVFHLLLSLSTLPVQLLLLDILETRARAPLKDALILITRAVRVLVTFRDCLAIINQQEIEVYVDIRMHGASGNRGRILLKQVLIVFFFGHWFGCLAHAMRVLGGALQQDIRPGAESSRDYFEKFEDESMVHFHSGRSFWQTYLLALYKGFNLNYEDLLPERPIDLSFEVLNSIALLLMKSYCIGSFFKFHQRRQLEHQKFADQLQVVNKYLDLYEMPASLRKAIVAHFRYQQGNHRRVQTMEVIASLPFEVQKKLRALEMLPLVQDRNPAIFGTGVAHEYRMALVMSLTSNFLQAGQVVFLEGEVSRDIVFLDTGVITVSRSALVDGKKTEQVLFYIRADRKEDKTATGAASSILGCVRFFSARVRADQEAVTISAPQAVFDGLNADFPDQREVLIRNIAAAHNLDIKGNDIQVHAVLDPLEAAIREELRLVFRERQEIWDSALTFAATRGDVRVVKDLLDKRVDANQGDYDGRCALHLAASEGMTDVLEVLLEAGGNANIKDRWGRTPMQDALSNHFIAAATLLRNHGGVLHLDDPAGELCTQASVGNTTLMQQYLNFGIDPDAGDYDARTALHLSASEGHLQVVAFLTSRQANVNVRDRWKSTPLQDAIRNDFPIVAAHLHKAGARLDNDFGASQLLEASSAGNASLVETLLMSGVDRNITDYDQRTPLHLAAAEGRVIVLDFLVNSAGAAHSPTDRWGSTPLQDAITGGHELCVQLLMAAGADLGPSAIAEQHRLVNSISKQMGFSERGGFKKYAQVTSNFRQRIGAHIMRARHGRARGDIFDTEQAARFNRAVVLGCISRMSALCEDARWLAELLVTFDAKAAPMWDFMRLVNNSVSLVKEAHFWQEAQSLKARILEASAGAKGKGHMSKDATDMAFHQAFLRGMRIAPELQAFRVHIADRVLARVEKLHQESGLAGPSAQRKAPPLGRILAQEALREMRVIDEDSADEVNIERVARGAAAQSRPRDGMPDTEELTARIKAIARVLVAGEHLALTCFDGPLMMNNGARCSAPSRRAAGALPSGAPQEALRAWLRGRSGACLRGEPTPPGAPPRASPDQALQATLQLLLPPACGGGKAPDMAAEAAGRLVAARPALWSPRLVAQELALLAMVAMVLDGWDRDMKLPTAKDEGNNAAGARERRFPHERRVSAGDSFVPEQQHRQLDHHDWLELGRICRRTALACRGRSTTDRAEQKAILRRLNRKLKERKKGEAVDHVAQQGDENHPPENEAHVDHPSLQHTTRQTGPDTTRLSTTAQEEEDEDVEMLPIRAAKVLVLDLHATTDELAKLVDVCDEWSGDAGPHKDARVFGDISRERFVLNVLRCMSDHDESQEEVMEPHVEAEARRTAKVEQEIIRNCTLRSQQPLQEEEDSLWVEIDDLHEGFSDTSENDSEEHQRRSFAMYAHGAKGSQFFGGRTHSSLALASKPVGPKFTAAAAIGWLTFPCRCFSKEGRSRRRRARMARRFRELDSDGDGIGLSDMALLLAVAFNHTLGAEGEIRWAYRVFELLEKADVGDLATLDEVFNVLPTLEDEIKDQQRKNRRTATDGGSETLIITRFASRLVIPPDSQSMRVWDRVRTFVVLYYVFEVPVHFCFLSLSPVAAEYPVGWSALSTFADVFMGVNVLLSFFRAYVNDGKVVSSFTDIRMRYIFGYFVWDAIACLPVDIIAAPTNGDAGLLARPAAAVRLVRLLHMRNLFSKFSASDADFGFGRVASFTTFLILLLVHFLACVWWLLGTRYDNFHPLRAFNDTYQFDKNVDVGGDRGSWLFGYVHRPGEPPIGATSGVTPFWWQYLTSFYWCAGRVTLQSSSGNLYGASWVELGWSCVLFFINVAVTGYCDGILVDKVIQGDEAEIEAKSMRNIVEDYVQSADLPEDLVKDVRKSAEQCSRAAVRESMERCIEALPHSLKQRVARRIFLPHFSSELFSGCSETFLVELGVHCRIVSFDKNQVLASHGEPAHQLPVLLAGRLTILGEGGEHLAETAKSGELIGEMPFIFDLKHVVSLITAEESRVMILKKADFRNACRLYPHDSMALKRAALKAIQEVSGEGGEEEGSQVQGNVKRGVSKSKSTLSFATAAAMSSSGSHVGHSAMVSHALRRMYAGDLRLVMARLKQEEETAKKNIICNFIQLAADGNVAAVEHTLAQGDIDVNAADYDQRTPLHLAVCNGRLEVAKLLIEKFGANLGARDRFGNTPVDDALREKHVDILKYLASLDDDYKVAGDVAACLCQAAADNDLETLRMFVEYVRTDPNVSDYDKRTPLHLGASQGHLGVVQLLANRPNLDFSPQDRLGFTPLDDAIRHKHQDVRDFLISRGALVGSSHKGLLLCELAAEGDVMSIKELYVSGVDITQADHDSRSAMHLAASNNHFRVVSFLVKDLKANPNPFDRFLNTPLDDAIRHGHRAIQSLLLDCSGLQGSDPKLALAAAQFKKNLEIKEQRRQTERLKQEIDRSEVATLYRKLHALRESAVLEDDIHTFVSHTATFRSLLLECMSRSLQTGDAGDEATEVDAASGGAAVWLSTKELREQLLLKLAAETDEVCSRLTGTLEKEVLAWLNGLSKAEERILRLFVPGLQPVARRVVGNLKGRAQLEKFANHLWRPSSAHEGRGSYKCKPLALLMHRIAGGGTFALDLHEARLEALALVWTSSASPGTASGAPHVAEPHAVGHEGAGGRWGAPQSDRVAPLESAALRTLLAGAHAHDEPRGPADSAQLLGVV